ncbi:MAG: putative porin [Bdellovibrionaceae bacterium]|nr:putative porin [Bdellovibrio sp.]
MIFRALTFSLVTIFSVQMWAQEKKTSAVENIIVTPEPKKEVVELIKKSEFTGDFRYRYQQITNGSTKERRRNQLMFRVGQNIQLQDDLKFTYRLMTGAEAGSGNVTLGGTATPATSGNQGSPRQFIGLDLAYGTYNPAKDVSIFFGKNAQYFYFASKNQIILDRDITPEGVGVQYKTGLFDDTLMATVNLGGFWVAEKYSATDELNDTFLSVAQLNLMYKFSDFQIIAGYGMFNYSDVKGELPTSFSNLSTTSNARGNTLVGGRYLNNYEIKQASLEVKWNMKPFEVSIFGEADENTAADTLGRASLLGTSFVWDRISLTYMYQRVEKDAVFAIYTDGDFAGGVTSSEGSIISAGYKLSKNAIVSYTTYQNRYGIDVASTDYARSNVDLTLSF